DGSMAEFPDYQIWSIGGIAAGPDGNLWFTELFTRDALPMIERITPSGESRRFRVPGARVGPGGITAGPDGNLWFIFPDRLVGGEEGLIGRITPTGDITEFPVADVGAPIIAGPDGNLWFFGPGMSLSRISTDGVVTSFPLPISLTGSTPFATPGLTNGPDVNVWIAAVAPRTGN